MVAPLQIGGASSIRGAHTPTAVRQPDVLGTSLGAIAQGLEGVEGILGITRQTDTAADKLTAARAKGVARREWEEGTASLDPTDPTYMTQVEEVLNAGRETAMGNEFLTSEVRDKMQIDLEGEVQAAMLQSSITRRDATQDATETELDKISDDMLAMAEDDPDTGFDDALDAYDAALEDLGPGLAPGMADTKREEYKDQLLIAKAIGLANQGRHDEAKQWAEDIAGDLTLEKARAVKRTLRGIQENQRQDFRAETAAEMADFNIRITEAQSLQDTGELRAGVEQMDESGRFAGQEGVKADMVSRIAAAERRLIDDQRDLTTGLGMYNAGIGTRTPKQTDAVWGSIAAKFPEDMEQESRDQMMAEFSARAGMMPTEGLHLNRTSETTENPALLAQAARTTAMILDKAPQVKTDAGRRNDTVRSLVELQGLSWEEAAQLTIERAPDAAEAKVRDQEFNEVFEIDKGEAFDARGFMADAGIAPERGFFSPFTTTVGASREMERDIDRAVRQSYRLYGDPEIAKNAAAKNLSRVYGPSSVGAADGAQSVQKYPPQRYLQVPGFSETEKERVLTGFGKRTLEAFNVQTQEGPNGEPGHRWLADRQTASEIERGMAPSYEIQVLDQFGNYVSVPVPTRGTGRGIGDVNVPLRRTIPQGEDVFQIQEVAEIRNRNRAAAEKAQREFRANQDLTMVAPVEGEVPGSPQDQAALKSALFPSPREALDAHPFAGFITGAE